MTEPHRADAPQAALGRILLYVRDIEAVARFYALHFGFRIHREAGDRIVELESPGGVGSNINRQGRRIHRGYGSRQRDDGRNARHRIFRGCRRTRHQSLEGLNGQSPLFPETNRLEPRRTARRGCRLVERGTAHSRTFVSA